MTRKKTWHDITLPCFRLAGFAWYAQDKVFRRLPIAPSHPLPGGIDQLANCTAGGQVAFRSNSRRLVVRAELAGPADMNHMPATGQCGFDLYLGAPFAQRFQMVTKYDHRQTTYDAVLFEHPARTMRSFTLNFPLYQGVKKLQIGLEPGARLASPLPWSRHGRIVMYGTSIVQGGCASRPGMAHTNLLSRALNVEVINLGFSGSALAEPEVIQAFAAVPDPLLFVLDYEANTDSQAMKTTLPEAIRILRRHHETIPILVISRNAYAQDLTHGNMRQERDRCRAIQANTVKAFRKQGDRRIFFLDGSTMLGSDFDECTVDGVHPTDLGFLRMARRMETVIRKILRR